MERWILAIGYDQDKSAEAQEEWLKDGIFIPMVPDIQKAAVELPRNHSYLLVAIFFDKANFLLGMLLLRSLTRAPILVMKHRYDLYPLRGKVFCGCCHHASNVTDSN